jgi:hypothetical protein
LPYFDDTVALQKQQNRHIVRNSTAYAVRIVFFIILMIFGRNESDSHKAVTKLSISTLNATGKKIKRDNRIIGLPRKKRKGKIEQLLFDCEK